MSGKTRVPVLLIGALLLAAMPLQNKRSVKNNTGADLLNLITMGYSDKAMLVFEREECVWTSVRRFERCRLLQLPRLYLQRGRVPNAELLFIQSCARHRFYYQTGHASKPDITRRHYPRGYQAHLRRQCLRWLSQLRAKRQQLREF